MADSDVGRRLDGDAKCARDGSSWTRDEGRGSSLNSGGSDSGVAHIAAERRLVRNREDGRDGNTRGGDAQGEQASGWVAAEMIFQRVAESSLLGRAKRGDCASDHEGELDDSRRFGDNRLSRGERRKGRCNGRRRRWRL